MGSCTPGGQDAFCASCFRLRGRWTVDDSAVLRGWRRRIGDPQADTIPPHVTLLPPTRVGAARLPVIEAHLARAAEEVTAFPMHLSGTGTFRPVSQVVFVQVGEVA